MNTEIVDTPPAPNCCGTCGCRSVAGVTPRVHPLVQKLLNQSSELFRLLDLFGSPLSILLPEILRENIRDFERELEARYLQGKVFYTSKPNKSVGLLRYHSARGGSVDVSSEASLKQALAAGFPGARIHATGPKSLPYVALAIAHQVLISIDSARELAMIREIAQSMRCTARVVVRLCGFNSLQVKFSSGPGIFGIPVGDYAAIREQLTNSSAQVAFEGFSFHWERATTEERLLGFEQCFERLLEWKARGSTASIINVGGGFPICLAESQTEWSNFLQYLKRSVLGEVKPITWQGSGLGFRLEKHGDVSRLGGAPAFAEHYVARDKHRSFSDFLDATPRLLQSLGISKNATVSSLLQDAGVILHLEPGRGALDQVGITIARVLEKREIAPNQRILRLEMNSSNLMSAQQKLLTQPLFIRKPRAAVPGPGKSCFLFGNLCYASDLICAQKVYPPWEVSEGDLIVFVNTAPYLSDFVESGSLGHSVAEKIIAVQAQGEQSIASTADAQWEFHQDGRFCAWASLLKQRPSPCVSTEGESVIQPDSADRAATRSSGCNDSSGVRV